MNKVNSDTFCGIFFLMFCSFAWWQVKNLPAGVGYENSIGPEFFPAIMTIVVALLSLLLIIRSLWGKAVENGQGPVMAGASTLFLMGLFMALLVVYVFLYEILGFILSSCLILPTGMFLLGERRILHAIIFPCILIGLAWLVFTKVMMVPIPEFSFTL